MNGIDWAGMSFTRQRRELVAHYMMGEGLGGCDVETTAECINQHIKSEARKATAAQVRADMLAIPGLLRQVVGAQLKYGGQTAAEIARGLKLTEDQVRQVAEQLGVNLDRFGLAPGVIPATPIAPEGGNVVPLRKAR